MLLFVTGLAVEVGGVLVRGLDCAWTEVVVETFGGGLVRGLDCAWTEVVVETFGGGLDCAWTEVVVVVGGVVVETLAVWSSLSVLMVPKRKAPRNRVLILTIFLEDFVIIFDQYFLLLLKSNITGFHSHHYNQKNLNDLQKDPSLYLR